MRNAFTLGAVIFAAVLVASPVVAQTSEEPASATDIWEIARGGLL